MIDSRLQLLLAVADYGTVTAAAESMYRSPSGVSKQLKELAAELDVDLLERDGRRVKLTAAGNRLVEHVRAMNAQWESALSDTAAAATQLCGAVTIGAFPTVLAAVVAPAIAELIRQYPTLIPMAREVYSSETLLQLEMGQIDVGLVVAGEDGPMADDPRVHITALAQEPIDLLVPADHPFAKRDAVELREAAFETWITGNERQDSYAEVLSATRAVGFAPRIAHCAEEWTAVTALVGQGLGITAIPRIAALAPGFNTKRIPLTGDQVPSRRILMCVRRGSAENPRIVATTGQLKQTADDVLRLDQD